VTVMVRTAATRSGRSLPVTATHTGPACIAALLTVPTTACPAVCVLHRCTGQAPHGSGMPPAQDAQAYKQRKRAELAGLIPEMRATLEAIDARLAQGQTVWVLAAGCIASAMRMAEGRLLSQ
jgi:hypothetical protein